MSKPKLNVVAIDGPSGAGKSTVSSELAKALGARLLDTGATYRAAAYIALQKKATSEKAFERIARELDFKISRDGKTLLVGGRNLGVRLRTERVSQMASFISQFKGVRKVITSKQRSVARRCSRHNPVVVEGRDIGTVVFPDARHKFFVTASPKVRAERRYEQLKARGVRVSLHSVLAEQAKRDKRDSTRAHAPLKCATDAIVVDTSEMTIKEVVGLLEKHIAGKT
ncbi:MAG: (d)CMP kinase [Deltaproteobacteria bacterium]|nr:(d)CMP kinase [Deltaproteobacteria bacterium]